MKREIIVHIYLNKITESQTVTLYLHYEGTPPKRVEVPSDPRDGNKDEVVSGSKRVEVPSDPRDGNKDD